MWHGQNFTGFISYTRTDGYDDAHNLVSLVRMRKFGVIIDIDDTVAPGSGAFMTPIFTAIERARVFFVQETEDHVQEIGNLNLTRMNYCGREMEFAISRRQ